MTISVPLIVKDEEKHIKECLDNLSWAKEVILVDTGSTDKTLDIAKNYPNVQIFKEPKLFLVKHEGKKLFCFDKARNFALSKCTGDYILILDADERIYDPAPLFDMMENHNHVDVWYLFQGSRLSNGKVSPCMTTRFWKNGLGIHYSNMVHETVDGYVDEKGLKRGKTDVIIDHLGFIDDKFSAVKSQRVIDAIEYEGHPYKNYYLGVAYAQMQDTEHAIEYLEKSFNDEMPFNIKAHAVTLLGDVYRQYSAFYLQLAIERLEYSKKICPEQNLSHIVMAEIKRFKGQNPMCEFKKVKRRNYKTSDMHQDLLLTDEQIVEFENDFSKVA